MTYKVGFDKSSSSDVAQLFRQQGATWIEGLFPRPFVKQLSKYYFRKYASLSQSELESRFACVGDRRYMIATEIKGKLNDPVLYANDRLMPVLQDLLGNGFVVSSFGSVIAFPGAQSQPVHFDYPPLFESEATCATLPPHAITLVVPLVDLTETTGSTSLWLKSHTSAGARLKLQELVESGSSEGAVFPLAKMGDAYLMDFRLIHSGMPNNSSIARPILYIVYSRPWFNESMNFAEQPRINLSRKQYRKIPKAWRHLFESALA